MALLVSCGWLAEPCQAQKLYEHVQHIFVPLDKSEIQSGILMDQTPTFIWPGRYDGRNIADSMRLSLDHFGMLYGQFRNATVSNRDTLPLPEVFLSKSPGLYQKSDTVNLALMAMQYDYIHKDALEDSLIIWSEGQLFDVPGRTASPYRQDTSFAFTALNQKGTGLRCFFKLPSELIFNNLNWELSTVEIDFDNGRGFQSFNPGHSIEINYNDSGIKTIRLQLEHNGNTFNMSTFVEVMEESSGGDIRDNAPYDPDNGDSISLSGMDLTIFTACDDGKVRRPLIVLEGFGGNTDYTDMFGLLEEPNSSGLILEDYLNTNEYDLIWVDYKPPFGGFASVETNANHLIEVIEYVNARKHADGSSEPNVLIGNSMGGLVGKFALLKMHNVLDLDSEIERFFTFDAPLKGANFPIGIQAFIQDLIDQAGDIGASTSSLMEALFLLDSPASKDLLKHRVRLSYPTNFPDPQLSVNTWDFDAFQASMNNLESIRALNEITRHIAIANGADMGILQESIQGSADLIDAMEILRFLVVLDHEIGNDNNANLYDIRISAIAYAPVNSFDLRYYRQFLIDKFVLDDVIESQLSLSVPTDIIHDNTPGGTSNLGLPQIDEALSSLLSDLTADVDEVEETSYSVPMLSFCFIPTISALDMSSNTPPETSTPTGGSSVERWSASNDNLSQSPYSYQPEFNQDHVSINTRIADLIASELSPSTPFTLLTSPLITGEIYNFGQAPPPLNGIPSSTAPSISDSLTIQDGGELWINRDDRLSYTNLNTVTNNHPRTHVVTVPGINCDEDLSADVVIETGGKIIIGDYENNIFNSGHLNFGKHSALTVNGLDAVYVDKKSKLSFSGGSSLLINPNSRIETHDKAHFGIHGGAQATIESTGRLELNEETTATISGIGADGNPSRLHVRAGATLRASTGSQIIVEHGGILEIDAGANIELWWSESNIHIKDGGELIINGDFSFVGKGFFQFSAGNTLSFGPNAEGLTLAGQAKDRRFIQINGGVLDIGDHSLYLSNGMVVGPGSIYSDSGASVRLDEVTMAASGGYHGIVLNNPVYFRAYKVDFRGYNIATHIRNFDDQTQSLLESGFHRCLFTDNLTAALIENSSFIRFSVCNILESDAPLIFQNVAAVNLESSSIYSTAEGAFGTKLDNVGLFFMSGSTIDNYDIGIKVAESSVSATNKSNILMKSGATIQNCNQGIFINKGGIDVNGVDYGLVSMKCAKLIENGVGIAGVDVLLDIDGCIENDPNCAAPFSNTFITGLTGSQYFDICLLDRDDIETVSATNNYWDNQPNNGPGNFNNYSIIRISDLYDCNNSMPTNPTFNIDLNAADALSQAPTKCTGSTPNPGPVPNPDDTASYFGKPSECNLNIAGQQHLLHMQYGSAFYDFRTEDRASALTKFQAIAGIANTDRDDASQICRHYIDVSRVMAHAMANPSYATTNSDGWTDESVQTNELFSLTIAPNPASQVVSIQVPQGQYQMEVYDLLGQLQQRSAITQTTSLDVKQWQTGIYIIKITDTETNKWRQEKLVVQR